MVKKPRQLELLTPPKKQEVVPEPKKKLLNLEDFTVLSILGRGSFGEVSLVQHKFSGELFALKQIKKERIRG